jgi:short-subunit dehydrogenase involved in D-alanine esterification of teichoic acids
VGGLIHNAGIQCDLRLDDAACTPQALRQEVDVNLLAPMVLTRLLLSHLQARGQAGAPAFVVNVTSGLAFAPKRTAAAYSATKAGLHLFSRGLRVQLAGTPVRVVEAVMPLVDTPMTAGRGQGKLPAEQAARALLDGLAAGRSTVYIGKARFVPLLHRWAPAVLDRVLQRA